LGIGRSEIEFEPLDEGLFFARFLISSGISDTVVIIKEEQGTGDVRGWGKAI
jgi:hypothetical protein